MANINFKFMAQSTYYTGSTKETEKRKAESIVRRLKVRVEELNFDYTPKELIEIYASLQKRLKNPAYRKAPIDTIEIKFFATNVMSGESLDTCHDIFSRAWYMNHNVTDKTKAKYKNHIEDFVFYLNDQGLTHISQIDDDAVTDYLLHFRNKGNYTSARNGTKVVQRHVTLNHKTPAVYTWNDRLKTLKYLFGILSKNYPSIPLCKDVSMMKGENSNGYSREDFTDDELDKIEAYLRSSDKYCDTAPRMAYVIGLWTGLRLSDFAYLEREEFFYNKANDQWHISTALDKTSHHTDKVKVKIPVSGEFLDFMKPYLENRKGYLFQEILELYKKKKGGTRENKISSHFKGMLDRAGVRHQETSEDRGHKVCTRGIHSLRHTFCRQLAEVDTKIPVITKLMGHAGVKMTMNYLKRVTDKEAEDTYDALAKIQKKRNER